MSIDPVKCYVCQEEIPDGECCFTVGSGDYSISRHASCESFVCLDCDYIGLLESFHKRSHGGWDCPKCYGEITKE
jgi:hypothetical protein